MAFLSNSCGCSHLPRSTNKKSPPSVSFFYFGGRQTRVVEPEALTVLREYEKTPMTGGYADSVELYWFGSGINGQSIGISETTWNRGLRELLDKRFLWPKTSSSYWTNPALFFKGNRVIFIKEYRRKSVPSDRDPNTVDLINGKTDRELNQI